MKSFGYIPLILSFTVDSAAFAQSLYVDTNGTASGFGSETTASWDASIWKPDTSGTSTTMNWIAGSVATFGTGAGRNLTIGLGATDVSLSGLRFNHAATITSSGGVLTSSGNLTVSGGASATIAANLNIGANQLINSATGTLTLSGSNTLGGIQTTSGTLTAGSTGAFGFGTVSVQGGNLNLNGHNVASQVITGNLTNSTVTNAQAYTGTVLFNGDYVSGQLDGYVGPNPTANGVFPAANIVLSGTNWVSLRYQTSGSVTLESANADLRLSAFTGTATQIGALTVNAGKIYTDGDASGTLETLTVNGDLRLNNGSFTAFDGSTQSGTASLYFNLGGMDGLESSKLVVTGTAFLAGNLIITGHATGETTFDLIDAGSFVGTFDSITLPTLNEGFVWDTSQLYGTGQISIVSAIPEPATFAALSGLVTLALAATRRRSRHA